MNHLPPTSCLISFCSAARHQSVTLAARELNLTHGAISRSIKQLEDWFGFTLFERRNRRIYLNARGTAFYQQTRPILDDLQEACDRLRQQPVQNRLTLSCEPSLAMRWLMPRMGQLQPILPDTDIHLATGGGPIDLVGQQLDLAIRRSDFSWPDDYWVTPLGKEWIGPVCHPDMVDRFHANDFIALQTRTRPTGWQDWRDASNHAASPASERIFDHFYFSLQAASAGLGVAIGPGQLVYDDLRQGLLVAPAGFVETGIDYVVLTARKPESDRKLELLVSWLVSTFTETQP